MRDYFSGLYFRCQSGQQTLAVIPAVHRSSGQTSCSIQLLTENGAWNVPFPRGVYQKKRWEIHIAENSFGPNGIRLDLRTNELTAYGSLRFGALTPICYDIMGPFRYVPFMECRHSVVSMHHTVDGELTVNGTPYRFQSGAGYLEGDRGYSFPKSYAWTQCFFPGGSVMLSIADIPFCGACFTGIIGVIHWRGREYRLATYLGAKVIQLRKGSILIRQGNLLLEIRQLEQMGHPLHAPTHGAMVRTIHEQCACRAFYRFRANGQTLFAFEAPNAAFEFEYP